MIGRVLGLCLPVSRQFDFYLNVWSRARPFVLFGRPFDFYLNFIGRVLDFSLAVGRQFVLYLNIWLTA